MVQTEKVNWARMRYPAFVEWMHKEREEVPRELNCQAKEIGLLVATNCKVAHGPTVT
jgi:hypothetical protein